MRIAYFDCFSGISGDMTIAAFLDAGLSVNRLSKELGKLKLKGYEIKKTKTRRGSIAGTKFDCIVNDKTHSHRPLKDIIALIDKSSLSKRVKTIAKDIFARIGKAEARIHGMSSDSDVYLHELGDIDSIIDIVGTAIAIDELGIDEIYSSKITMGRTFVNTRHGALPVPAPASLELLKGVPMDVSDIEAELVTPTGAGILSSLSKGFGRMPQMKISCVGYGAGTRNLTEIPNMLRVIIGDTQNSFKEDSVVVIETNIDDMNPQHFEYLFDKLFGSGALDVYATTVLMKRTRPGFRLTVLAEKPLLEKLCSIIFSETTTIGIRYFEANRFKLERKESSVPTKYGNVKVKLSKGDGRILTASPEHAECVRLARMKNVPLKEVYDEAKKETRMLGI